MTGSTLADIKKILGIFLFLLSLGPINLLADSPAKSIWIAIPKFDYSQHPEDIYFPIAMFDGLKWHAPWPRPFDEKIIEASEMDLKNIPEAWTGKSKLPGTWNLSYVDGSKQVSIITKIKKTNCSCQDAYGIQFNKRSSSRACLAVTGEVSAYCAQELKTTSSTKEFDNRFQSLVAAESTFKNKLSKLESTTINKVFLVGPERNFAFASFLKMFAKNQSALDSCYEGTNCSPPCLGFAYMSGWYLNGKKIQALNEDSDVVDCSKDSAGYSYSPDPLGMLTFGKHSYLIEQSNGYEAHGVNIYEVLGNKMVQVFSTDTDPETGKPLYAYCGC